MEKIKIKYLVRIYADAEHEECTAIAISDDLLDLFRFLGHSPYWEMRDFDAEVDA